MKVGNMVSDYISMQVYIPFLYMALFFGYIFEKLYENEKRNIGIYSLFLFHLLTGTH